MKYKVDFLREAVLLIIAMFLMCITTVSYTHLVAIHVLDNSRIFPIRSLSLPRYFQTIW